MRCPSVQISGRAPGSPANGLSSGAAPSGAQFYTGDAFPAWRGSLFVGGLRDTRLVRLTIGDDRVAGEEHLLAGRGQRVRDVRQGPDGALYVVTGEDDGEVWKIVPRR